MPDTSQYKVGIVVSVETKSSSGKKPLKVCAINIGGDEPVTVVTSASNVREGSRIVIAPVGSTIIDDEGEELTLKKATVGGFPSEGMFCDAKMLGWGSGSAGIAAQVPESYEPGMAPPETKPGVPKGSGGGESSTNNNIPAVEVKGLFEKKLTKEEKKKLAEEKRKAKKAAKEAKKKEEKTDS